MHMQPYTVTVRDAVGRERTLRVVATTAQNASNQALLNVKRETGRKDWMVVKAVEADLDDALVRDIRLAGM